ncbi:MAG: hypothetical protein AAFR87_32740, partial [Bacteroidota bacterium]
VWEKQTLDYTELVEKILSNESIWGEDMTRIPELCTAIAGFVELIDKHDMEEALTYLLNDIS